MSLPAYSARRQRAIHTPHQRQTSSLNVRLSDRHNKVAMCCLVRHSVADVNTHTQSHHRPTQLERLIIQNLAFQNDDWIRIANCRLTTPKTRSYYQTSQPLVATFNNPRASLQLYGATTFNPGTELCRARQFSNRVLSKKKTEILRTCTTLQNIVNAVHLFKSASIARITLRKLTNCSWWAIGTSEDNWTRQLSAGHIQAFRSRIDNVVDRLHGKVPRHEFDDRLQSVERCTDADASEAGLSNRCVHHTRWPVLLQQAFRHLFVCFVRLEWRIARFQRLFQ
jgi:hypothetical protein